MRNLLQETINTIKDLNESIDDIKFIGSEDGEYSCTWKEFTDLADRNYGIKFVCTQIASDLVIIFNNGTKITRIENLMSEWWQCSSILCACKTTKTIKQLFTIDGKYTLHELNNEN